MLYVMVFLNNVTAIYSSICKLRTGSLKLIQMSLCKSACLTNPKTFFLAKKVVRRLHFINEPILWYRLSNVFKMIISSSGKFPT